MIVNPVVKMRPHPAAHPLGATYTQSRCKTQSSCDLKRKFLSCLAPNTCFCFHFRLSMSAMWLASWATLVFVCNTLFSQRVIRWDAKVWVKHDLPDVLVWMKFLVVSILTWYTRALRGINSLWITVRFCSFRQLHMVFDGPGEELAVVALWIKVHPV